jgi:hypothetical protein
MVRALDEPLAENLARPGRQNPEALEGDEVLEAMRHRALDPGFPGAFARLPGLPKPS